MKLKFNRHQNILWLAFLVLLQLKCQCGQFTLGYLTLTLRHQQLAQLFLLQSYCARWLWFFKVFNTIVSCGLWIFYPTYIYLHYRYNLHFFSRANARWYEKIDCIFFCSSHGLCYLGIFTLTKQGIEGSIYQMISHGLISAALFLCVGVVYDRLHSRMISTYGGLVNYIPKYFLFLIFVLAALGLPGTSGFLGGFLF